MNNGNFAVYIASNFHRTVLYVGVTNDLKRRLYEHFENCKYNRGFTGKYNCTDCVYYELLPDASQAIRREKQLKGWSREKKLQLITEFNPEWKSFNEIICGFWPPVLL